MKLGSIASLFAQPVAWCLWAATFGRWDLRSCEACRARREWLNGLGLWMSPIDRLRLWRAKGLRRNQNRRL